MKTIIITPPVVQFNTPYPSGAYLKAFFSDESHWYDLNIQLFYKIFSAEGLTRLFQLSENKALKLADKAEREGDADTAFNLRRYISQKQAWIEWIDFITASLCDGGRSLGGSSPWEKSAPGASAPGGSAPGEKSAPDVKSAPGESALGGSAPDVKSAPSDLTPQYNGRPLTNQTSTAGSFSARGRISGRERAHQFLYSPFAPRGSRMENYLAGLEREPSVDDVRFLSTFALADLSDYITVAFDPNFSLVRYAEALTVDSRTFSDFEKEIDSPLMEHFYQPLLQSLFSEVNRGPEAPDAHAHSAPQSLSASQSHSDPQAHSPQAPHAHTLNKSPSPELFVCISIPFAGTFLPALYTARFFKRTFGDRAFIVIGGGFVNTELRQASEPALAKYLDAISYDRGYGSYKALFSTEEVAELYKMRLFLRKADGSIIVKEPLWKDSAIEAYENQMTVNIIPDYSDIDFSIYPRMCDDRNAMHRIWTDGAWIKAYLAHGCYWHKCAFCDTSLDYVCAYKLTDVEKLFNGLLKTAREKGVYGIHFVDEALPPIALKKFALLNARAGNPLYFWGNVRFEKSFTKDLAAFLSYCGLGGVSAGIESATGTGLEAINKGTDIKSITSASCAFKEAGILVHAYMIYGFWNDTAQTIVDSMETLRQFFAAGLLDSAFWHKFVLTRNSTVYKQWEKEGKLDLVSGDQGSSAFARNNLHFKGEEKYNKYGPALDAAVNAWMHGDRLDMKVQKWFDFPLPAPNVPRDFIEKKIEAYEKQNLERYQSLNPQKVKNLWWLGGYPVACGKEVRWIYLMEEESAPAAAFDFDLLPLLRPEASEEERAAALKKMEDKAQLISGLKTLLGRGLVLLDF